MSSSPPSPTQPSPSNPNVFSRPLDRQKALTSDSTSTGASSSSFSSSYTSFSSIFDQHPSHSRSDSFATNEDRRASGGSMTSWDEDDTAEKDSTTARKQTTSPDAIDGQDVDEEVLQNRRPSVQSQPSSNSLDSAQSQRLATPTEERSSPFFPDDPDPELEPDTTSPASSATSSIPSKDGSTPRAEIAAPLWPLSQLSPTTGKHSPSRKAGARLVDEAGENALQGENAGSLGLAKKGSLQREGSSRKKPSSQESAVAPGTTPPSGAFALREIPPFKPILQNRTQSKGSTASSSTVKPETETARPPHIHAHFPSPTTISRYPSTSASTSTSRARPSTPPAPAHRVVATSEITGCTISAPISPPAHYPIPTPPPSRDHFQPNTPSSSSTASTRSSSSSGRSSLSAPPPPRWARPPTKSNSVSGRALSMNNKDRPDVDFDFQHDFDPELFEGQEGEWIEIIKGSEGRIAVKSTPKEYLVMVWLPGFQIENITIATRGSRTIHLVADQWDEGDHAQWDIKLGADANLGAVAAKFSGDELRISVARHRASSPDIWKGLRDPKTGEIPGRRDMREENVGKAQYPSRSAARPGVGGRTTSATAMAAGGGG